MRKPIKPAVSQFAGLRNLSDKAKAQLMASPDAPGPEPLPLAPPAATPEPSLPPEKPKRGRGRPPRMAREDGYEATTIMMHPSLKNEVRFHLAIEAVRDKKPAKTLSEVIQLMLVAWCNKQEELDAKAEAEGRYPFKHNLPTS